MTDLSRNTFLLPPKRIKTKYKVYARVTVGKARTHKIKMSVQTDCIEDLSQYTIDVIAKKLNVPRNKITSYAVTIFQQV